MNTKQILIKKEVGDIKEVSKIMGISSDYTLKILNRPTAKLHHTAINILKKIIEAREKLYEEVKNEIVNQ